MRGRFQGDPEIWGYAAAAAACLVVGAGLAVVAANIDAEDEAQYAGICMDQASGNRLDDDRCGDWDDDGVTHVSGTYMIWLPTDGSTSVPPVGRPLPPGVRAVRTVPKGSPVAKGTPKAGGAITRGGLGVSGAKAGGGKGASSGS